LEERKNRDNQNNILPAAILADWVMMYISASFLQLLMSGNNRVAAPLDYLKKETSSKRNKQIVLRISTV
jgi:hypothetical protein